jgi:hypothetical protein
MKKIVLAFVISMVAFAGSVNAQLRKIPAAVTDTFATRYPNAEKVEWSDKLSSFEASFMLKGVAVKAGFSSQGNWKYSEKTMTFEALSADVKDGFSKSKYSDWKTGTVVEQQQFGKDTQYKVSVEKSSPFQKKNLYFNANGRLLKESIAL